MNVVGIALMVDPRIREDDKYHALTLSKAVQVERETDTLTCHSRECGNPSFRGNDLRLWKKNNRIYILANKCRGDCFHGEESPCFGAIFGLRHLKEILRRLRMRARVKCCCRKNGARGNGMQERR